MAGFYRVELIERTQDGGERKFWSRWYLIDDRKPGDKTEIEEQLKLYRRNNITVQFQAVEATLPE